MLSVNVILNLTWLENRLCFREQDITTKKKVF